MTHIIHDLQHLVPMHVPSVKYRHANFGKKTKIVSQLKTPITLEKYSLP